MTKAVFEQLYTRISDLHQELGSTAGLDPLQDRFRVGYIAGLRDIVNTDVDDVVEGANRD